MDQEFNKGTWLDSVTSCEEQSFAAKYLGCEQSEISPEQAEILKRMKENIAARQHAENTTQ